LLTECVVKDFVSHKHLKHSNKKRKNDDYTFDKPLILLVNLQYQSLTSVENMYDNLMKGAIKRISIICNILQIFNCKSGWTNDQTILNC
jgi:hypothetical protein